MTKSSSLIPAELDVAHAPDRETASSRRAPGTGRRMARPTASSSATRAGSRVRQVRSYRQAVPAASASARFC